MKKIIIVTFAAAIIGVSLLLYSAEDISYKRYKCERFCKDRYESCMLRASIKKGREKNKVTAICESRLYDCYTRCTKIKL